MFRLSPWAFLLCAPSWVLFVSCVCVWMHPLPNPMLVAISCFSITCYISDHGVIDAASGKPSAQERNCARETQSWLWRVAALISQVGSFPSSTHTSLLQKVMGKADVSLQTGISTCARSWRHWEEIQPLQLRPPQVQGFTGSASRISRPSSWSGLWHCGWWVDFWYSFLSVASSRCGWEPSGSMRFLQHTDVELVRSFVWKSVLLLSCGCMLYQWECPPWPVSFMYSHLLLLSV